MPNKILDLLSENEFPDISDVDSHRLEEPNPGVTFRGQHLIEMQCTRAMILAVKPKRVIEVGVEKGWSAAAIIGFESSIQYYIGCDVAASKFTRNSPFKLFNFYHGSYQKFVAEFLKSDQEKFDMMHMDSEHYNEQYIRGYLESFPKICNSGALVIIHDMDVGCVERELVKKYLHLFDAHLFTHKSDLVGLIDEYPNLSFLMDNKQAQFIGILK